MVKGYKKSDTHTDDTLDFINSSRTAHARGTRNVFIFICYQCMCIGKILR